VFSGLVTVYREIINEIIRNVKDLNKKTYIQIDKILIILRHTKIQEFMVLGEILKCFWKNF